MQEPRFKAGIHEKAEDGVESMSINCFIHVTPASRRSQTRHLVKMIVHPTLLRNWRENISLDGMGSETDQV